MKHTLLLLLTLLILNSCKEQVSTAEDLPTKNYTLVPDDINITVEKFDSTVVDINKYNANNEVFKVGTSFKYKFKHVDRTGVSYNFENNPNNGRSWKFVHQDSLTNSSITSVTISVLDGNPMADMMPDYNQTNIKYELNGAKNYSTSGVIENEANIWMHPPRQNYFRILELNPFPYIKAPYKIGTSWQWSLDIGSAWGDERWKTWEGGITNKYTYTITGKETIETTLGSLSCFIVESSATSRIGNTALKAYFNETYGFVTLDYTNIDGSKTKLELVEHYSPEK